MKKPNITPGPWYITQKANGPKRIETITCRRVCTMANDPTDQTEADARARLIAAAPQLAEALEMALKCTRAAIHDLDPHNELGNDHPEKAALMLECGVYFNALKAAGYTE